MMNRLLTIHDVAQVSGGRIRLPMERRPTIKIYYDDGVGILTSDPATRNIGWGGDSPAEVAGRLNFPEPETSCFLSDIIFGHPVCTHSLTGDGYFAYITYIIFRSQNGLPLTW
jgi:hypothetical protein